MKNKILIPLVVFTMLMLPSYSQEKKLIRKAELATDKMEYGKAIMYYDKVLAVDSNSYRANAGKGMVLATFLDRYDQAIPYLVKALKETPKDTLIRIQNTLGRSYEYVNDYPRALYYYGRVSAYGKAGNPDYDVMLNVRVANCKYAMAHTTIAPASEQWIKNVGSVINTEMPEYGAVVMGNDLIFTSERKDTPKEKRNGVTHKYFESMYKTTLTDGVYSEPIRYTMPDLEGNDNYIKHNEAVISASTDGKILYIFRDGKIFETNTTDPAQEVDKMNKKVNIAHYQNHACLSPDGTELYFVSRDKKGYGGTDIYVTTKNKDGNWSTPEILSSTVNSYFDEDAPFMSSDGTLFFSSNGLPGYGGFDVYKTHKEKGLWTTPENLGQPINSAGDDLYFSLGNNSTEGYYSSARVGGYGDMDIYQVHYAPAKTIDSIVGMVSINIPLEVDYDLIAEDEMAMDDDIDSTIYFQNKRDDQMKNVPVSNWNPATVYFDFDKYTLHTNGLAILDDNITELKLNAGYTFAIRGYADSRGTDAYNMKLSAERANYVKQYLIDKGISYKRITATNGFGETLPVNNCIDGVVCTDDQYQLNRRVEFKIIDRENKVIPYLGLSKK